MIDSLRKLQRQIPTHIFRPCDASDGGNDMENAIIQIEGQAKAQVPLRDRPAPQLLIAARIDVLEISPDGMVRIVKVLRRRTAQGGQVIRLRHILHFKDVFVGQPHALCRVIAVSSVPLKAVVKISVFQHQGENIPAAETLILHIAAIGDFLVLDAPQTLLYGLAIGGSNLLIDGGSVGCVIFYLRHAERIIV